MSIPYEQARDEWAKRKVIEQRTELLKMGIPIGVTYANGARVVNYVDADPPKPDEITIIDIDIDPGGDYQIGDMTWDHDDPASRSPTNWMDAGTRCPPSWTSESWSGRSWR